MKARLHSLWVTMGDPQWVERAVKATTELNRRECLLCSHAKYCLTAPHVAVTYLIFWDRNSEFTFDHHFIRVLLMYHLQHHDPFCWPFWFSFNVHQHHIRVGFTKQLGVISREQRSLNLLFFFSLKKLPSSETNPRDCTMPLQWQRFMQLSFWLVLGDNSANFYHSMNEVIIKRFSWNWSYDPMQRWWQTPWWGPDVKEQEIVHQPDHLWA